MSTLKIVACATALISSAAIANAAWAGHKSPNLGASTVSPGQDMRTSGGPIAGEHGASDFAPGQEMRESNTSGTPPGQFAEPGASGFAPGDNISKGKK
jgi:hypothetical protein